MEPFNFHSILEGKWSLGNTLENTALDSQFQSTLAAKEPFIQLFTSKVAPQAPKKVKFGSKEWSED